MDELTTFDLLDDEHERSLRRGVMNILSTDVAEVAFAQLFDGLPTEQSLRDSSPPLNGHPVFELRHSDPCEGFLAKAREFRTRLDLSQLRFSQKLLLAFQNTEPESRDFHLRLVEVVVVACHQMAAHVFELDGGAHKHQLHRDWLRGPEAERWTEVRGYSPPPIAFFHEYYTESERYPRGLGDIAGYWAEGKIFGGVVVFDRGESDSEVRRAPVRMETGC